MNMRVSVVVPTYNEGKNVVPLIDEIYHTMNGHNPPRDLPEVVVIDDNSPDGTAAICQAMVAKYRTLKIVVRTDAKGLASAVKRGIEESSGETVVVMDADLSHDCSIIPKLVAAVTDDSADIAIASRYVSGGRMVAPLHLRVGSEALNLFIATVLMMPVRDLTGGFFAAKKTSLQALDSESVFTGYGDYSFALLYAGFRRGLRLKEYPFEYYPRQVGASKTRFFNAGLTYAVRALKLRLGFQ